VAAQAERIERETEVRDRIFRSALRHFSQKGFAATSLREIASDAQTTKPMIYYYFKSKEELYASIVHEILGELAASISDSLPAEGEAIARISAYAERYLDAFLAKEEVIALVLREVFGLGGAPMAEFSQSLADQVRHPLDEIVAAGMASGELRTDGVSIVSTAVLGILNMFILAHVFGGAGIHRGNPLRQVTYYTAGLRNPDR